METEHSLSIDIEKLYRYLKLDYKPKHDIQSLPKLQQLLNEELM